MRVRHGCNLLHRVDGAKRVGEMADGDKLRFGAEKLLELLHDQFAAIIDGRHAQLRAFFLTQHLPRNNVGMVLHRGDQNFITVRTFFRP